ncbi:putative multiple-sugar transport system permease YteP [Paenibacillus allorhizoplanae]|uniref:Multiple-sugar transport system permease YteP n=1 Tax=Paenibacillus allorhizoplanae TaxID=2905648 RepID=A0ABN8G0C8_9BACL|nr:ABC transporter permease subunit [Paenibacillus allorhizoplanae]CAH1192426.1 putative multiple-sugar transport system permease YteP [Paenibacillus allorhizoplanae]
MDGAVNAKQRVRSPRLSVTGRWLRFKSQFALQSMVWPGILFLLVFSYIPMYGILIAFKEYDLFLGVMNSPWIGFTHFQEFLNDPNFLNVLRNTLAMNLMGLVLGFPAPIVFALFLNELNKKRFKSFVQTISYLPHFVSWVIFGGLVLTVLSPSNGILNLLLTSLHIIDEPINFIAKPHLFWMIMVSAEILKGIGWGAIIYIAAIAGVDQEMYDAAKIDGASRFQRMWYVTLPAIMGTVVIMLIFAISSILNTGFEQIMVMQNPLNLDVSETIDTYVYKVGLRQMRYSYSTAVGLAKSVVALILLFAANYVSRKVTDNSLF